MPSFISKYFKVTPKAMAASDNGRICELDPTNNDRVLVWKAGQSGDGFDDLSWSQKKLWEASNEGRQSILLGKRLIPKYLANRATDPNLRISRKQITGSSLEIQHRDLYNAPELASIKDLPSMSNSLAGAKLGFFQAKMHKWVYIISTRAEGKAADMPSPTTSSPLSKIA
jgi:hypothetical protein